MSYVCAGAANGGGGCTTFSLEIDARAGANGPGSLSRGDGR